MGSIYRTPSRKGEKPNSELKKSLSSELIIGPENRLNHVRQRPIKVFPRLEVELFDEQNVVLETGVHVRIEPQCHNDGIVVAVDVRIDTKEAFDKLADSRLEVLGEMDAWYGVSIPTDPDIGERRMPGSENRVALIYLSLKERRIHY